MYAIKVLSEQVHFQFFTHAGETRCFCVFCLSKGNLRKFLASNGVDVDICTEYKYDNFGFNEIVLNVLAS